VVAVVGSLSYLWPVPRSNLAFRPYGELHDEPNVIVDGSPTPATTLTLSHWPGIAAPPSELWADLSAEMAFRYLVHPSVLHGEARAVSVNHFDQDGLVGLFALVDPDAALARQDRLEDVAAAGDFATFRHRDAARVSMVISAFSDAERSPFARLPDDYGERTAQLCTEVLGRLPELVDDVGRYRHLWADEDAQLAESEAALAAGVARVEEHPDVDLAVVTLGGTQRWSGHRFAGRRYEGMHPMAIHGATTATRILLLGEGLFRLTQRYETWVQLRSRPVLPRVDLTPLAERLSAADTVEWRADVVAELTPELQAVDPAGSSLDPGIVTASVIEYLRVAPPAFDPFSPEPTATSP
jgi:hypothetical protein